MLCRAKPLKFARADTDTLALLLLLSFGVIARHAVATGQRLSRAVQSHVTVYVTALQAK